MLPSLSLSLSLLRRRRVGWSHADRARFLCLFCMILCSMFLLRSSVIFVALDSTRRLCLLVRRRLPCFVSLLLVGFQRWPRVLVSFLFTGHLPETRARAAHHGEGRVGAARVVQAEGWPKRQEHVRRVLRLRTGEQKMKMCGFQNFVPFWG